MTAAAPIPDESQRIAAILAGQREQFHDLIRPYERRVYAMALALLKNEADAEEAAQEAFLKAYRNLSSFRAESRFSTWLVSIALNEARSVLRRRNQLPTDSIEESGKDQSGNDQPRIRPALLRDWREIPSETLERAEVRLILRTAIDNLPALYREIFLLRDLEELSVSECAAALGITVSAAKVRLHRARMHLQRELAPQLRHLNPKRRWFPW